MSLAIDQILRLNQTPISWTSTRSLFNGIFAFSGITEVNVEESREGELVHAQQPDGTPIGITSGLYKVDSFGLQMTVDAGELLFETLALSFNPLTGVAGGSFGDARFSYQLIMGEPFGPQMSITVNGCKIEKRKMSAQKGTGALVWDLEMKAMTVRSIGALYGLSGIMSQLWSLQRGI